ncbi:substrate-binding periplasmic protein [Vogesella facilis]|uniref:Substrate-binding periplasmic protein n=1 Tax=Vogesella facilis TaxID=1655232 RepID=A0ABV7RCC9_9NEIS
MSKLKLGMALAMLLAATVQAQTLTVCAERWVPFIYRADNGAVSGLAVEALARAARERGVSLRYQFLALSGCYQQAAAGRTDIIAFATAAESPAGWLQTRQAMVYWPLYAWVRASVAGQQYRGLQQFAGLRVAWVPAYDYPRQLVRQTRWQRVPAPDSVASFTMLAGGRVDVVFDDYQTPLDMAHQLGGRVKRLEGLVGSYHETFSLRPGLAWLRAGLEREARRQIASGELDAFYRQYFRVSWQQVRAAPH